MKSFANVNARSVEEALRLLQDGRQQNRRVSLAGGGSDLLGMIKDDLVAPDVLVNLKPIEGLHSVTPYAGGILIGGSITLNRLAEHPRVRADYTVLAEAAGSVGTPQIRNVGTLAGNVCQRPWCWYLRAGFPCFKNGGDMCFSWIGENQFNAIFGGGPSYIVHPSDAAPALVALEARFHIAGPAGERVVPASEFFTLPRTDVSRENVLEADELLTAVEIPAAPEGTTSRYVKVLDREAWTHAVVSAAFVFRMEDGTCRGARVVLGGVAPIPWRVTEVEAMLRGQRITPELAARAGRQAVAGAEPLAKNAYKVSMTENLVRRTLLELAG
jgi:xanthine dehydrogenase YagS FAD-binding subunit